MLPQPVNHDSDTARTNFRILESNCLNDADTDALFEDSVSSRKFGKVEVNGNNLVVVLLRIVSAERINGSPTCRLFWQ